MDPSQEERYARYADPATGKPGLGPMVEAVVSDAKAYFEAQKELTTLEISEKAGRAAAVGALAVVLILVLSAAFLFASVALALWLGALIGSTVQGFLCVAGIDVAIGALFYWFWRSVLQDKITLAVIRAMHGNS